MRIVLSEQEVEQAIGFWLTNCKVREPVVVTQVEIMRGRKDAPRRFVVTVEDQATAATRPAESGNAHATYAAR